jgi:hypothetical protein
VPASGPSITDIKMLFARSGDRCAFPKCTARMALDETLTGEVWRGGHEQAAGIADATTGQKYGIGDRAQAHRLGRLRIAVALTRRGLGYRPEVAPEEESSHRLA